MSELNVNLLKLMTEAWRKTTFQEYRKKRQMWWIERDLIDSFYFFLRPVIDLLPQYELFSSEWYYKLTPSKKGKTKLDLAVIEPIISVILSSHKS